MNQPESKNDVTRTAGDKPMTRKPYQKPEVRHERVFETMALACGKTATQGQCHGNRKSS